MINTGSAEVMSSAEIIDRGISCLLDGLGAVDTERFISVMIRERFDYTKWRARLTDMSAEEFNSAAVAYAREHPFRAKKSLIPVE